MADPPADEDDRDDRFEFDQATDVHRRPDASVFDAVVDEGWTVGPKPNGGYLLALAGRAAADAVHEAGGDHPHPLGATAHFLRAPDPGPAEVHTAVLRVGRGASQVRASIVQGDQPCVDAVFTLGRLAPPEDGDGPWWTARPPFEVAPLDDCVRLASAAPGAAFPVAIMDRSDLRLDPSVLGFTSGQPSGRADLRGWISFADGRPADPLGLLFFLDALPPATFELARTGWVPTLSLTAYVRAWPAPGPLRVRQYVTSVDEGRIDEVCELWDDTGRLVGQATQLAAVRIPEGLEPPTT